MSSVQEMKTDKDGYVWQFDEKIPEDERRFYMTAYANLNNITERKVHCTVCQEHIGTAPWQEKIVRMHPILRLTHCEKCHGFYSSGDFDRGEDGSELYCRWCGQGGQVYCCSRCPFVFCKPCIVSNLSAGVIEDIENNENWSCFSCSPKMIWPLRAQHWALINYIEKQKKIILAGNHSESDVKKLMSKDTSSCCRGKSELKISEVSENVKPRHSEKRVRRILPKESHSDDGSPVLKKIKLSSGIVCTPDILQILEPHRTMPGSQKNSNSARSKPYVPKNYITQSSAQSKRANQTAATPPLLVVRNSSSSPQMSTSITRKTVSPTTTTQSPVFHTINGFRIDLNSAAKHETFRLPNGKLIQVKRQNTGKTNAVTSSHMPSNTGQSVPPQVVTSSIRVNPTTIVHTNQQTYRGQLQPRSTMAQLPAQLTQFAVQHAQSQSQPVSITQPSHSVATVRFSGQTLQANAITNIQNGTIQVINNQVQSNGVSIRNLSPLVKHQYGSSSLGRTRTQLQNQVYTAFDVCQLINGKILNFTNSNAYKNVRSNIEVKELYIHLSYMLTYAMGRFKEIQTKCLADMRALGFSIDANSLENGQLAADKQASDDEDGDIEIVEPERDTINLDSDEEDEENVSMASSAQLNVNKDDIVLPIEIDLRNKSNDKNQTQRNLCSADDELVSMSGEQLPPNNEQKEKLQNNQVNNNNLTSSLIKEQQIESLPKPTESDPKLQMQCVVVLPNIDSSKLFSAASSNDNEVKTPNEECNIDETPTDKIESMEIDSEIVEDPDKVPLAEKDSILKSWLTTDQEISNKENNGTRKDLVVDLLSGNAERKGSEEKGEQEPKEQIEAMDVELHRENEPALQLDLENPLTTDVNKRQKTDKPEPETEPEPEQKGVSAQVTEIDDENKLENEIENKQENQPESKQGNEQENKQENEPESQQENEPPGSERKSNSENETEPKKMLTETKSSSEIELKSETDLYVKSSDQIEPDSLKENLTDISDVEKEIEMKESSTKPDNNI